MNRCRRRTQSRNPAPDAGVFRRWSHRREPARPPTPRSTPRRSSRPARPPCPTAGASSTRDEVRGRRRQPRWISGSRWVRRARRSRRNWPAFLGVKRSLLGQLRFVGEPARLCALTSQRLPDRKGASATATRSSPARRVFPRPSRRSSRHGRGARVHRQRPGHGQCAIARSSRRALPRRASTKAVMMAHALGNPFDLATVLAFL